MGSKKFINKKGVILLKKSEKHLEDLTSLEINKHISNIARESNQPLEYIFDIFR